MVQLYALSDTIIELPRDPPKLEWVPRDFILADGIVIFETHQPGIFIDELLSVYLEKENFSNRYDWIHSLGFFKSENHYFNSQGVRVTPDLEAAKFSKGHFMHPVELDCLKKDMEFTIEDKLWEDALQEEELRIREEEAPWIEVLKRMKRVMEGLDLYTDCKGYYIRTVRDPKGYRKSFRYRWDQKTGTLVNVDTKTHWSIYLWDVENPEDIHFGPAADPYEVFPKISKEEEASLRPTNIPGVFTNEKGSLCTGYGDTLKVFDWDRAAGCFRNRDRDDQGFYDVALRPMAGRPPGFRTVMRYEFPPGFEAAKGNINEPSNPFAPTVSSWAPSLVPGGRKRFRKDTRRGRTQPRTETSSIPLSSSASVFGGTIGFGETTGFGEFTGVGRPDSVKKESTYDTKPSSARDRFDAFEPASSSSTSTQVMDEAQISDPARRTVEILPRTRADTMALHIVKANATPYKSIPEDDGFEHSTERHCLPVDNYPKLESSFNESTASSKVGVSSSGSSTTDTTMDKDTKAPEGSKDTAVAIKTCDSSTPVDLRADSASEGKCEMALKRDNHTVSDDTPQSLDAVNRQGQKGRSIHDSSHEIQDRPDTSSLSAVLLEPCTLQGTADEVGHFQERNLQVEATEVYHATPECFYKMADFKGQTYRTEHDCILTDGYGKLFYVVDDHCMEYLWIWEVGALHCSILNLWYDENFKKCDHFPALLNGPGPYPFPWAKHTDTHTKTEPCICNTAPVKDPKLSIGSTQKAQILITMEELERLIDAKVQERVAIDVQAQLTEALRKRGLQNDDVAPAHVREAHPVAANKPPEVLPGANSIPNAQVAQSVAKARAEPCPVANVRVKAHPVVNIRMKAQPVPSVRVKAQLVPSVRVNTHIIPSVCVNAQLVPNARAMARPVLNVRAMAHLAVVGTPPKVQETQLMPYFSPRNHGASSAVEVRPKTAAALPEASKVLLKPRREANILTGSIRPPAPVPMTFGACKKHEKGNLLTLGLIAVAGAFWSFMA